MGRGGASPPDDPDAPDHQGGEDEPVNGVHGLADLARGMQHVAQAASDISGQAFINLLNHYIDPDTGQAIEKRIVLPGGQVLDVPLFAIVPPSTLVLKHLKIRMSVEVHDVAVKAHQYDKHMPKVDRTSFKVSFAPSDPDNVRRKNGGGKLMDMEMVFEAEPPPEAVRRIQEMFTDMMKPQDPKDANKYGVPKRPNGDGMDHGLDPTPDAGLPVIDALDESDEGRYYDGPDDDPNSDPTTGPEPTTADPMEDTQELPPITDADLDDTVSTDDPSDPT